MKKKDLEKYKQDKAAFMKKLSQNFPAGEIEAYKALMTTASIAYDSGYMVLAQQVMEIFGNPPK